MPVCNVNDTVFLAGKGRPTDFSQQWHSEGRRKVSCTESVGAGLRLVSAVAWKAGADHGC